jgi:hypothetical protein
MRSWGPENENGVPTFTHHSSLWQTLGRTGEKEAINGGGWVNFGQSAKLHSHWLLEKGDMTTWFVISATQYWQSQPLSLRKLGEASLAGTEFLAISLVYSQKIPVGWRNPVIMNENWQKIARKKNTAGVGFIVTCGEGHLIHIRKRP